MKKPTKRRNYSAISSGRKHKTIAIVNIGAVQGAMADQRSRPPAPQGSFCKRLGMNKVPPISPDKDFQPLQYFMTPCPPSLLHLEPSLPLITPTTPSLMPSTTSPTNSSSQSWSSYILSTYSSSISPTHDADQYAPAATPISPFSSSIPPSPMFPSTPNSPWGPYTKAGRGGAGNFTWQSSQSPTNPPDPEAGLKHSSLTERQRAAAEVEAMEQADALNSRKGSEYAHTGRGGAGNCTPSSDVAPPALAPEIPPPSTADPYVAARSGYYGRGGAGNHSSNSDAALRAKTEAEEAERRRGEEVRRQVEESVQAEMRRPEGAVTREGRHREVGGIV